MQAPFVLIGFACLVASSAAAPLTPTSPAPPQLSIFDFWQMICRDVFLISMDKTHIITSFAAMKPVAQRHFIDMADALPHHAPSLRDIFTEAEPEDVRPLMLTCEYLKRTGKKLSLKHI